MGENISINVTKVKNNLRKTNDFLKQKKVFTTLIVIVFLAFLIWSSSIRLENLNLLKDQTTGEYIPLALDPFYFLRIAETLNEEGRLPMYDSFRKPYDVPYTKEILPASVVYMYKFISVLDKDVSIRFVNIISPVVFFALGLIVFFFLVYSLTGSKMAAILSSIFLSIIPSYLYRTMAGFSDHEAIGVFAFFLVLLVYTLGLKFLDRKEHIKHIHLKTVFFSLLVGFFSAFTIASWGGVANFMFMVIPLSFGLFWLVKTHTPFEEKTDRKKFLEYVVFYSVWSISTIIFNTFYGYGIIDSFRRIILTPTNFLVGFFLLFILIDFVLISKKGILKTDRLKKYRIFLSFFGTIILGIIIVLLFFGGWSYIIDNILNRLLQPFGTDRVGLTVAENQQPFLNDWIAQTGKIFFWFFVGGLMTIGINMAGRLKQTKSRFLFSGFWILFILGLLFSRISSASLFNGTNFISKLFYFGSALLFFGYLIFVYFKERVEIKPEYLIIFSWAIFMLIAARSAIRTFFLITPFACFSYGFFVVNITSYFKKSREELSKMFFGVLLVVVIVASIFSFINLSGITKVQASNTGPSAGTQWQQTMAWVRENTPENSIFLHWWDYGYWVQYLGQRPTLSDGGHFQGSFRDHVIGRYVLTTPDPETALSFMKTNNASYLLIDPTDIGKYSAYSSIGSDATGNDRTSYIPTMIIDPSQTQETGNSEIRIYQGTAAVDGDIIYKEHNEDEIFLPGKRSAILGFRLQINGGPNTVSFNQPEGVYFYNNQQFRIPIRYVYYNDQILDFGSGLKGGILLMPVISQSSQGIQVLDFGAGTYLSPKVFDSLVAQLYIMDDPFNKYTSLALVHTQQDPVVSSLKSQGLRTGDFVFFNGIRGPIKIWDTRNIPENILKKEEFLRTSGEFAEFDGLQFTR